jgi:ABC-type uncharacterized transport system permease subunit
MTALLLNRTRRVLSSPARIALLGGLILVLFSVVRLITHAHDITSDGASGATLRFTIPILMCGLGGLWSERSGVINIGLEGMMIAGTWLGAWFGYLYGPWVGMGAAIIGGLVLGLLHAVLTVKIGVDQAVSGLAINLLGYGSARFLSGVFFPAAGGDILSSPAVNAVASFTIPGLSPWLLQLEHRNIFILSDTAGIMAGLVTNTSWASAILLLALPITSWILWRSRFGLRLRFSGENPVAAESLGVNVYRTRYIAIAISGALAALGGAYLSVISTGHYLENQTGGRGYIGLATVIFGNWRPGGVLGGSLLFGLTDALRVRQSTSVHAILLVVVILALLYGLAQIRKRNFKGMITSIACGGLILVYFLAVKVVPDEFITFFPNLTTIIVLALLAQRLRPPAMVGAPYRKGEESS